MPPIDASPQSVIRYKEVKVCKRCKSEKSRDDFYQDRSMSDGIINICKECKRSEHAEYKRTHREKIRECVRAYWCSRRGTRKNLYATNAGYRKKQKAYERLHPHTTQTPRPENNRHRKIARDAVNRALKVGTLVRQSCVVCSNPRSHAHHQNYERALDVVWLCNLHHRELHLKYTEDIETPILRRLRAEFEEVNHAPIRQFN